MESYIMVVIFTFVGFVLFFASRYLAKNEAEFNRNCKCTQAVVIGYYTGRSSHQRNLKIKFTDEGKENITGCQTRRIASSRDCPEGTIINIAYIKKNFLGIAVYEVLSTDDRFKPPPVRSLISVFNIICTLTWVVAGIFIIAGMINR